MWLELFGFLGASLFLISRAAKNKKVPPMQPPLAGITGPSDIEDLFKKAAKLKDMDAVHHLTDMAEVAAHGIRKISTRHFAFMMCISGFYRLRDRDSCFLEKAVKYCEEQIQIASKVARSFKKEFPDHPLPAHTGFTQLAIILEKQGKIDDAIALCIRARDQGWAGDWEKRIARLEAKGEKLRHPK